MSITGPTWCKKIHSVFSTDIKCRKTKNEDNNHYLGYLDMTSQLKKNYGLKCNIFKQVGHKVSSEKDNHARKSMWCETHRTGISDKSKMDGLSINEQTFIEFVEVS